MVTVNQITEFTELTEQNLPTLITLDCHGNALTDAKNINIPTLRKLYLVRPNTLWLTLIANVYRQTIRLIH